MFVQVVPVFIVTIRFIVVRSLFVRVVSDRNCTILVIDWVVTVFDVTIVFVIVRVVPVRDATIFVVSVKFNIVVIDIVSIDFTIRRCYEQLCCGSENKGQIVRASNPRGDVMGANCYAVTQLPLGTGMLHLCMFVFAFYCYDGTLAKPSYQNSHISNCI